LHDQGTLALRRRDGEERTQGLRRIVEREMATGFFDLGGGERGRERGRGQGRGAVIGRRGGGGGGRSELPMGFGLLVAGQGPTDFFLADQGVCVEFQGEGVHFCRGGGGGG